MRMLMSAFVSIHVQPVKHDDMKCGVGSGAHRQRGEGPGLALAVSARAEATFSHRVVQNRQFSELPLLYILRWKTAS